MTLCSSVIPFSPLPPPAPAGADTVTPPLYDTKMLQQPSLGEATCVGAAVMGSSALRQPDLPCDPRHDWSDAPLGGSPTPVPAGPSLSPHCGILPFCSLQGFDGL